MHQPGLDHLGICRAACRAACCVACRAACCVACRAACRGRLGSRAAVHQPSLDNLGTSHNVPVQVRHSAPVSARCNVKCLGLPPVGKGDALPAISSQPSWKLAIPLLDNRVRLRLRQELLARPFVHRRPQLQPILYGRPRHTSRETLGILRLLIVNYKRRWSLQLAQSARHFSSKVARTHGVSASTSLHLSTFYSLCYMYGLQGYSSMWQLNVAFPKIGKKELGFPRCRSNFHAKHRPRSRTRLWGMVRPE